MKKRGFIACLLAAAMTSAMLAGCGETADSTVSSGAEVNKEGFPIVDEPITLTMLCPVTSMNSDPNKNMSFFSAMEELTNIKMEVNAVSSSSFPEKINLLFASGDLPDVIFGCALSASDEYSYGEQGLLLPLQDLIEEYGPNLRKMFEERPEVKKQITIPTGDIVSLPSVSESDTAGIWVRYYINQNWLDKLGLSMPTTPDEWYTVLKAFKENDPNGNGIQDEIPWSMFDALLFMKRFAYFWGINSTEDRGMYVDDSGKVQNAFVQPEMKEAFKFFAKLYQEGLIDSEVFSMSSEQFNAKAQKDENVIGSFVYIQPEQATGTDINRALEYKSMPPFVAENGKQIYPSTRAISRGLAAIPSKSKNPAAALRWLDYLYSRDGHVLREYGAPGALYTSYDPETKNIYLTDATGGEELRAKQTLSAGVVLPGRFYDDVIEISAIEKDSESAALQEEAKKNAAELVPYLNEAFPQMYFDNTNQKRMDLLNTDITKYVDETLVKFVTGSLNIDTEWDNYVAELEKMGLQEIIDIYQDAYDSYINN